jgi:S1-C subfamily serine protease
MTSNTEWAFPPQLQPKAAEFSFDLERALNSLVLLRAEVPEDAFTASNLGTERIGNGVVIREDGLILTIGYLITEASEIWLTTNQGQVLPGYALASDHASGLGLVQPLGQLRVRPLARGSARSCQVDDAVLVASHGGRAHAVKARVIARREFAGSWEYLLDDAIFTSPAHPQWGGAALIGEEGSLLGIGSLLVQEGIDGKNVQGNMFVPIDLIEPILGDLLTQGRASGPVRPWLGLYATEVSGQLVVAATAHGGPAHKASVKPGDVLLEVAGEKVAGLADLFRKTWRLGAAGAKVPLTVARSGAVTEISVHSGDRQDFLKKPHLH